jgi:GTP-binding protein
LGIRFLKHIERTRVLAVLVPADSEDPAGEASLLMRELSAYSPLLAQKPACFILSKNDLLTKDSTTRVPAGWHSLSAVTGDGVASVLGRLKTLIDANSPQSLPSQDPEIAP